MQVFGEAVGRGGVSGGGAVCPYAGGIEPGTGFPD